MKKTIQIRINGIVIRSFVENEHNQNHQNMNGYIEMEINAFNKHYSNLKVDFNVPYGESPLTSEIEVSSLKKSGYEAAWDHGSFVIEFKKYFKKLIGIHGKAINLPSSVRLNIKNSKFSHESCIKIQVDPTSNTW